MRKTKLIIIVAIFALIVVGGAYAAWTSRATISVNASAGEMDVEITSITIGNVSEYVAFGTDSIAVSEDRKTAAISISNLYPGAEANATIIITNIGTIPIMLNNASMVRELAVNMETNEDLSAQEAGNLIVKYTFTADTVNGQIRMSDSTSEAAGTLFENTGVVIEAGKTVEFDMLLILDREASDETENALFRFQFVPVFIQPNMGSSGGESFNESQTDGAPATLAPATEEASNPNDSSSNFMSGTVLEGLTVQNNGMLGAWNGSEEYSGGAKEIVIPSAIDDINIMRVGQNTFRDKGLDAVIFQEGSQIERIHARAFQGNQLTEIVLPDSLTRIDTRAFYDNPISTVIIPDGVTTIENNAFNNLTKITVGSNLTDLKSGAINGSNSFRDAYLSENGGAGTYIWDGTSWKKS